MAKKFDATKHELVPKHEKISEKDKKELFDKYIADPKNLPRILKSDPAIGNLHPKEGDIIKITRKSQTAGETAFFRRVVT